MLPAGPNAFYVVPTQFIAHMRSHGAARQHGRTGGCEVLEMRHALAHKGFEEGAEQPTWVEGAIKCKTHRRAQRGRVPVANVGFPVAAYGYVDGNHQGPEARLLDAL